MKFADGNDPLFQEFKTIIGPNHLTPIEALTLAYNKQPEDDGKLVSVISWVLPITRQTRESNREQKTVPSKYWAYTKWYGEKFNTALRKHIVETFKIRGYMTTAPAIQPYFKVQDRTKKASIPTGRNGTLPMLPGRVHSAFPMVLSLKKGHAHRCRQCGHRFETAAQPQNRQDALLELFILCKQEL